MNRTAQAIWDSLEFRKPAMLEAVEPLSKMQIHWHPPNGGNSIAWLLWHIGEVEDNWVRDKILEVPRRYPFGVSVRDAGADDYPSKDDLLGYLTDVRAMTRQRLEDSHEADFDRRVEDDHYGQITVRQVWGGVVTSFAWHAGQIVLIARRLLPGE